VASAPRINSQPATSGVSPAEFPEPVSPPTRTVLQIRRAAFELTAPTRTHRAGAADRKVDAARGAGFVTLKPGYDL